MIIDRSILTSSPHMSRSPSKRKCRTLPHDRRHQHSSALIPIKKVAFHDMVAILQVEHCNELTDKEWKTIWYSRSDLSRFRRRDHKLWASVRDAPDPDKDILINIYGLETPESRQARHVRIRDCQLAVLVEQEQQWKQHITRPDVLAQKSKAISLKSTMNAHRRGMEVAEEVLEHVVRELRAQERGGYAGKPPPSPAVQRRRSHRTASRQYQSEHVRSNSLSSGNSMSTTATPSSNTMVDRPPQLPPSRSGSGSGSGSSGHSRSSASHHRRLHLSRTRSSPPTPLPLPSSSSTSSISSCSTSGHSRGHTSVHRSNSNSNGNGNSNNNSQRSERSLPRRSYQTKWTTPTTMDSKLTIPSRK